MKVSAGSISFSSGQNQSTIQVRSKQLYISMLSLLLSNIFTAYLAVTQNWSFQGVLLIYWIQSVIIGIFQFIKILDLDRFTTEGFKINGSSVQPTVATKLQTAFFFLVHYGLFHVVYFVFIMAESFFTSSQPIPLTGITLAGISYLVNHTVSFITNRQTDKQRVKNIGAMMFQPYARIIPMHLTIIFGATLNFATIFFFILKTFADLVMHISEHSQKNYVPIQDTQEKTIESEFQKHTVEGVSKNFKFLTILILFFFLAAVAFIMNIFFSIRNEMMAPLVLDPAQIDSKLVEPKTKTGTQRTLLSGILDEPTPQTSEELIGENTAEIPLEIPKKESEPKTNPASVIVDTNQKNCFNNTSQISCGTSHTGQDAQYSGAQQSYRDNGDGTITDLNTGLLWSKSVGAKQTYSQALQSAETLRLAGYNDWRIPTIKELYSLMDFSGIDPPAELQNSSGLTPFINTDFFEFKYGDISNGDRIIDSQWVTTNKYVSAVMNNQECFFGVNFADGRIKCYPTNGRNNGYYVRYVRGESYGNNTFQEKTFDTITDHSTGLTWQRIDSTYPMSWEDALEYCESLNLGGHNNWRLPNIKELQYIVDYSRSPDTTNSPAIDPIFFSTPIINQLGQIDFAYYWSSTTHITSNNPGAFATYISFGRGMGYMNGQYMDVHGAGSQRSDPKAGNIADYPVAFGPQGDVRRLHNFVRCVSEK